jgi:murein DD-endopeptidase MepM/ murein hydrolase activator NlpD
MSAKKLRARDKIARKMSKDGLVERNLTTGEGVHISKREAELNMRDGKPERETFLRNAKSSNAKPKSGQNRARHRQSEQARAPQPADNAAVNLQSLSAAADAPKPEDISRISPPPQYEPERAAEQPQPPRPDAVRPANGKSAEHRRFPQSILRSKPPPDVESARAALDTAKIVTGKSAADALKHDAPSALGFERGDTPQPSNPKAQKRQERSADANEPASQATQTQTDGKLIQEPASSLKTKQLPQDKNALPLQTNPKRKPVQSSNEPPTRTDGKVKSAAQRPQSTDNSEQSGMAARSQDAPPRDGKPDVPPRQNTPSKLRFSPNEAAQGPSRAEAKQAQKLGKAQEKAEKAVTKLETAKSKLPAKRKLRSRRVFNEETGKAKRKLYFESSVKPQGEHLKGAAPRSPVKAAGNLTIAHAHRKLYQVERENVAVEAAHKGELVAEGGVRSALRQYKVKTYRAVQRAERAAAKKSVGLAYQKTFAENPKLRSNVFSRMAQKRKIRKEYAKATREAQKAAKHVKQTGSAIGKAAVEVFKRHPVAGAVIAIVLLLLFVFMSFIGVFGGAGGGGLSGVLSSSYLAEDADADNAELSYGEWETDLQERIANAEAAYPGYDDYRYGVGDISHNPYELTAYLTAMYQSFSYSAIEQDLQALFAEQYQLTFTPSVETRYSDPADADDDGDYEPYDYHIMTVTLTAKSFSEIAASRLSGEQLQHYAALMRTKGGRQYIANPFDFDWLPYVTSYYGWRIHPISGVKDIHRGVDIGVPLGTAIRAGLDGTVTFAGRSGDYGNVAVIEDGRGLVSKYAHCDTLSVVAGQSVKTGDVIATVGSTGASTGAHLHLEVMKNGLYLNPLLFAETGNAGGSFARIDYPAYPGEPPTDDEFAAMLAVAEAQIAKPYIWGAAGPDSFDCSGFLCFTINQSGVDYVGRMGANALFHYCIPVLEPEPGDLIFFEKTYDAPLPITHVGLYIGNGYFIHAGRPVKYSNISEPYYAAHFYAYARLP